VFPTVTANDITGFPSFSNLAAILLIGFKSSIEWHFFQITRAEGQAARTGRLKAISINSVLVHQELDLARIHQLVKLFECSQVVRMYLNGKLPAIISHLFQQQFLNLLLIHTDSCNQDTQIGVSAWVVG
jgi:hypothetical protein